MTAIGAFLSGFRGKVPDAALTDLEPQLFRIRDDVFHDPVSRIGDADGVRFKCPLCWLNAGRSFVGVHGIICLRPHVPRDVPPGPGRWYMAGTGLHDLTLIHGSSSVLLTGGGCGAHFWVARGGVFMC